MPPFLSLIIPIHNHGEGLPRMFDSVAAQSIASSMEVVLVDDCSAEDYSPVVQQYCTRGLNVRLLRLATRHYTKNARLAGIEAAQGDVIGFADADDILWGTDVLEYHARLLVEEQADIVHFATALLNPEGQYLQEFIWMRPFTQRAEGDDIFRQYVNATGHRSNLCSKLISRSFAQSIVAEARKSNVLRHREDFLIAAYMLFHARLYIGSDRTGYGYRREDKDKIKAAGRAIDSFYMLEELVPYFKQHGCPPDVLVTFSNKLHRFMRNNLHTLCESAMGWEYPCLTDTFTAQLLEYASPTDAMRMLLSFFPEQKAQQLLETNKRLRHTLATLETTPQ